MQLWFRGAPMGERDIRIANIAERRAATAEELLANGFPIAMVAAAAGGAGELVMPFDRRDPASVLAGTLQ